MIRRIAVIDEDIRGWAHDHEVELKQYYSVILKAGKNGDLPELTDDPLIASYCKKNNCDLLTADKRSYVNFFDSEVHAIQIRKYDYLENAKKPILLVKMLD